MSVCVCFFATVSFTSSLGNNLVMGYSDTIWSWVTQTQYGHGALRQSGHGVLRHIMKIQWEHRRWGG